MSAKKRRLLRKSAERLKKKQRKAKKRSKKKRLQKKSRSGDVISHPKFRLGIILILGALAGGLLSALLGGSAAISWVAGLLGLIGLILVIWAFVEMV